MALGVGGLDDHVSPRGEVPGFPAEWGWESFLSTAAPMLLGAFNPEHCNAPLRYGAEAGAGAAFRGVAATVYKDRQELSALEKFLRQACYRDGGLDDDGRAVHMLTFDRNPLIFADVGGHLQWKILLGKLR